MNADQVKEVLVFIHDLWPKSDMDDADLDSWSRTIARLQHPDIARQALIRLKDTTDFTNPKRERFLDLLAKQTGTPRSQEPAVEAYPGYIQCMEGDRAGWFVPLCYPRDVPPDHVVLRHLQAMLDDHVATYGGTWQIIRDPTRQIPVAEMMSAMHKLRGTVPLNQRIAARMAGLQPEAEYRGTPTRPPDPEKPIKPVGPLRQALNDFFAGKPPKLQAPPDFDDGPPPTEADVPAVPDYQEQDEPF